MPDVPDPTAPVRAAEEKLITLTLKLKPDPNKPGGLGKRFKKFAQSIRSKAIEDGLAIIRAEIDAKGLRPSTMDPTEVPVDYTAVDTDDVGDYTPAMKKKDFRAGSGG